VRANSIRTLLLASVAALALSACNTIAGMGEDVQAGGQAVERTAEDTQRRM
jgi:entericidin B